MLIKYLIPGTSQIPERSGWPLAFFGSRRRKIRLAVGVTRDPRGRVIQPLRGRQGRGDKGGASNPGNSHLGVSIRVDYTSPQEPAAARVGIVV